MSEKYPRTPHLPWSPGCTKDDRKLISVEGLLNCDIVITEKADGSNVCLEREKVYARSHNDSPGHESFDALKALHATIRWSIPKDWQVFGEWMWARHSIAYERLPAYLLVFGVRESVQNRWLSWDDTTAWCATMSLSHVPLLWRGTIHSAQELEKLSISLTTKPSMGEMQEGLVVRIVEIIDNRQFEQSVGKWVRADHVQTSVHWTAQKIERNHLLV